jgi:hypothetical protein
MCEYSGRLIAWLDHELPDEEATNVEWHLGRCAECRQAASAYEEVSGAFLDCYEASYRETAVTVQPRRRASMYRKASSWTMGGVAAAAAILVAILLAQPRPEKLSIQLPSPPHAPPMAFERPRVPIIGDGWRDRWRASSSVSSRLNPAPSPVRSQWIAVEPTVEVALPADALFPPGAVPPGFSFIADVRP